MLDVAQELGSRVTEAVVASFGEEYNDIDALVRVSTRPEHGDYQINVALSLGKRLGKPPREVAQVLAESISFAGMAAKHEIAGPGFINVWIENLDLEMRLTSMAIDKKLGVIAPTKPLRIAVEYSAPNVAKEMHVGHLRTTIIGDAIARTLSFIGHDVVRQNHLGDWGTPYGMILEQFLDDGGAASFSGKSIVEITALYRRAAARYKTDEAFGQRARNRVVSLQAGEPDTLALWNQIVEFSLEHIDDVYERLGVLLTRDDLDPESQYNADLPLLVQELLDRKIAVIDDGAVCVFIDGMKNREGEPLPVIVRKNDGGYMYATTDLATVRYRVRDLNVDESIYVVDARQSDHFVQVFAVSRLAGWLPEDRVFRHVSFGTMQGEDGKPLKSRSGEIISLNSLLQEAEDRAGAELETRLPDISADERKALAHTIGIGALKYSDLSVKSSSNYIFSWDRALSFDGNTAPYLQYAHARIQSILRKAGEQDIAFEANRFNVGEQAEHDLALHLLRFGSTVVELADALEPHVLCAYLFETAKLFSAFYESCPILKSDVLSITQSRLSLSALTAEVIAKGLDLLGIQAPDRM